MTKKILPVLVVMLLAAGIALPLLLNFSLQETAGLPLAPAAGEESADDLLLRLQLAERGAGAEAKEILLELAERRDAIGYAANLSLAAGFSLRQEDELLYLRRALALYETTEVRFTLAERLAASGERSAAVAEYLSLLPDSEALEALYALETDIQLIFEALSTGRHWQAVADLTEALAESSLPDEYLIYYSQALVMLGQYRQAVAILTGLSQRLPENPIVLWHFARALEGMGETTKAISFYQQTGAEGAERLGRLYEQDGRTEKAAAAYANSVEPAALWRGAQLWDELGNHGRSLELYRHLASTEGVYHDDAAYRAYLLLSASGDPEANSFLPLLVNQPAWALRLGIEPAWPELTAADGDGDALLHRLDAYRAAGRHDLVAVELSIALNHAAPAEKTSLGAWYLAEKDYSQAVRWGVRALRDGYNRQAYELAYPRPFAEAVAEAAAEFAIERELIWAVMREESRFQANALSRVGAVGLMQVMPATGKEIAAGLKTGFSERDLYNPEVNIRFGAYYIRRMLDRFDGDVDKALAAYNGGPGNVRRWSDSVIGRQTNGFPTAVTYRETREYITKVKNSYLTYIWLYGAE